MKHKHNPILTPNARALRKAMTPQEKRLWYGFLRDYPIRILRQKVIDRFVVDFYCSKARLVIEIDGSQHYTDDGLEYDQIRTNLLDSLGLHVMRFTNPEINDSFDKVCTAIQDYIDSYEH